MKSKIIIAVLVLVSVFFTVLSNIKASEAEKQTTRAEQLEEQLMKTEESAQREAENAIKLAAMATEAETVAVRLQEELEKCKAGK